MNKHDLISFRLGNESSDWPYIYGTWLNKIIHQKGLFGAPDQADQFKNHHHNVERILKDPHTIVRVACLKEDTDVILGYCVARTPNILHWAFVRPDWRCIGLFKDLLPFEIRYQEVSDFIRKQTPLKGTHSNV